VLQEHSPNLEWLHTHQKCNSSYREDEEDFVVSFAGHVKTTTASAVMNDIHRGAEKGLDGLIKDVLSRFGEIVGADGRANLYMGQRESRTSSLENLPRHLCAGIVHFPAGAMDTSHVAGPALH
jgi:hypothetical protein